jgi:GNAT superfamily N-acetyltransferase
LTSSSIKDYATALNILKGRESDLETFTTYAPSNRFIEAYIDSEYLSFSIKDEDGSIFAMALGKDPVILKCDRLATSRGLSVDANEFEHRADWDFYSIDTSNFASQKICEVSSDGAEISAFLTMHAPNSSVWPNDPEILFWGEVRKENDLAALGALVQWRTGQVMFASIATHSDYRNQGLAQNLVKEMLSRATKMGLVHVGLGVFAENFSAKRAYEKVGFSLVNEFSSYNFVGG